MTDEWRSRGIEKGTEYAILTDELTKAWSGMSTRQYKDLKGLKKESLRDNMSTLELALNMVDEATTGVPVITSKKASELNHLVTDMIETSVRMVDEKKGD